MFFDRVISELAELGNEKAECDMERGRKFTISSGRLSRLYEVRHRIVVKSRLCQDVGLVTRRPYRYKTAPRIKRNMLSDIAKLYAPIGLLAQAITYSQDHDTRSVVSRTGVVRSTS